MAWHCEAYGPDGAEFDAICFLAEPGNRLCATAADCHTAMTAQRQRVFTRINELAASGDTTGVYLADEFTKPSDLLGATDDTS